MISCLLKIRMSVHFSSGKILENPFGQSKQLRFFLFYFFWIPLLAFFNIWIFKVSVHWQVPSYTNNGDLHARSIIKCYWRVSSFFSFFSRSIFQGGWVLLQNCHLGLEYMQELFLLLSDTTTVDEGFRVFITTEVSPKFPINLLQCSIKFTYDPPQGTVLWWSKVLPLLLMEKSMRSHYFWALLNTNFEKCVPLRWWYAL